MIDEHPENENEFAAKAPILDAWYLTGPTASGKSRVGMELAQRLDAEIVSLDSMAVYRGMDIGTAKPSGEDRQRWPHHLIDVVDPSDDFSISQYLQAAHDAADSIKARGREVLFVGGTPLYLKALLRGLYPGPPADWDFRNQVESEVEKYGLEVLHKRLMQVDPLTAHKLKPTDKRRIIRALEIYKVTGQPASHLQTQFEGENSRDSCRVFVLGWNRHILHQRIEARVDSMFDAGLVEEVRQLEERYTLGRTARQALGYREVLTHFTGEWNVEETHRRVVVRTRQFARRQETWFRSLSECRRLKQRSNASPEIVAEEIHQLGSIDNR